VIALLSVGVVAATFITVSGAMPRPATGAVPSSAQNPNVRALVRILGVLRRRQTRADRAPEVFSGSFSAGLAPVRSLQRLATTTSWGARIYLVPLVKTSPHGLPLNPSRGGIGISVNGRGGGCCETAQHVEHGRAYASGIHPWSLIMVVPDGIAKISVALKAPLDQSPPPVAIGRVRSNVAALRLRYDIRAGSGDLITWYSASGAVIKTIRP
jgi:hypothetical protein